MKMVLILEFELPEDGAKVESTMRATIQDFETSGLRDHQYRKDMYVAIKDKAEAVIDLVRSPG